MELTYTQPCRCIGPTLRFVKGECFTCGRFLESAIGQDEPDSAARDGFGALLAAVGRKRKQLDAERLRYAAPRTGRRVVIEPEPARAPAKTHGGRRTKPRSQAVRDVEFLTRTF